MRIRAPRIAQSKQDTTNQQTRPMPTTTADIDSTQAKARSTTVKSASSEPKPLSGPGLRDANLDLIRATAIVLVLINHLGILWPDTIPLFKQISSLGMYGVDLFFVLSGWLIGGLFWKESARFGDIQCFRFWLRRALRTMPPYFVALPITWFAAHMARHEPFDVSYLLFLQNYRTEVPFFSASWSLCVEEHFYLLLPIAAVVFRQNPRAIVSLLILLAVFSPVARFNDPLATPQAPFGYAETASHFRLTGVAIGVLCSYIANAHPSLWRELWNISRISGPVLFVVWSTLPWWPASHRFYFGFELSSLLAACFIIRVANRPPLWLSQIRLTSQLAVWSYSIYLTHGLLLQITIWLRNRFTEIPDAIHIANFFACTLAIGCLYYHAVERPAIRLRDSIVPRRGGIAK